MALLGTAMVLALFGVFPLSPTLYVPRWVAVSLSAAFLFGGWTLALTGAQSVFQARWLGVLRNALALGTLLALLVPFHWLAWSGSDPVTRWALRLFLGLFYAVVLLSGWLRHRGFPAGKA